MTNQRGQASKIIVRRARKGRVLTTEGEPKALAREEGLRAVNPSNEVNWTLELDVGESRTVKYRYQALILQSREWLDYSW